ncbi:MAG TPA: DUF1329 domain-containing protein [Terriglobales bacterium]|nr:DUF1329 domain-containing protein [Terriglobales bacterium]
MKATAVSPRQLTVARLLSVALTALALLAAFPDAAKADVTYTEEAYRALAEAGSDVPAPGTVINNSNWKIYRKYLTIGYQAFHQKSLPFYFGDGTEFNMVVTNYVPVPMPKIFVQHTEQYAGRVRLEPSSHGGWLAANYVAGLPFPKPSGPMAGVEIAYDALYRFSPYAYESWVDTHSIDRYRNESSTLFNSYFYRVMHLSDPDLGYPLNLPIAKGYWLLNRYEVVNPEQSKYTTQVVNFPDRQDTLPENYVFLPSLRRSIRLSNAAHCAPILGTEFINDDSFPVKFQIPFFDVKLLGKKTILAVDHVRQLNAKEGKTFPINEMYTHGDPLPGFMKPEYAKWEPMPVYVIDAKPLPSLGGYCYSHRVFYINADSYNILADEAYDVSGRLWKFNVYNWRISSLNDGEPFISTADYYGGIYDVQNAHMNMTGSWHGAPARIDKELDAGRLNAGVYGFPGSLSQVMR